MRVVLLTVVLLLAAACPGPRYVIPGLSLPPESMLEERLDYGPAVSFSRAAPLVQSFYFSNGKGWKFVESRMDRQLKGLGFAPAQDRTIGLAHGPFQFGNLYVSADWPYEVAVLYTGSGLLTTDIRDESPPSRAEFALLIYEAE